MADCISSFYREADGKSTLKDHGFMVEWAQRAGSLVFGEAETLCEDNIVTHINLCLFWHSQGNWRICYLHKGPSYYLRSNIFRANWFDRRRL